MAFLHNSRGNSGNFVYLLESLLNLFVYASEMDVQIKTEIEEDDSPLVDVSDLLQVEMKEDVIHNDGDSYNTKNSQQLEVDYSIKPSFKNRTVYNGKVQKVKLIPNKASVVAVEKFRYFE